MFLIIRRFLSPINLIESRIKKLEGGDLSSIIPVVGEDELSVLSHKFNTLILDVRSLLKQKERLLSDVSHELRTPLAKMRLSVAMLPGHKKIVTINKQIHALDAMITNILLSDKMASAYSNLKKEKISIEKLINKALELTHIKNVEIELKENLILNVDVVKTSIALKNLIDNAHKYSPSGSTIRVVEKGSSSHQIISVVDLGQGVPKDQIKNITKAFVRVPGTKQSGFGLGLSICYKVAKAHGGHLDIKNNDKLGATFSLFFPK